MQYPCSEKLLRQPIEILRHIQLDITKTTTHVKCDQEGLSANERTPKFNKIKESPAKLCIKAFKSLLNTQLITEFQASIAFLALLAAIRIIENIIVRRLKEIGSYLMLFFNK